MGDLARIIGSAPYGVSSYRQSFLAFWAAVLVQAGRGLADSEGNLLGQVMAHSAERAWRGLGGAGLLDLCVPALGSGSNVARIHDGSFNLKALTGGRLHEVRGATDGATLDVQLEAPPGSGTRTDLIYLETWLEEIQPTISPEAASNLVKNRGNSDNATPLSNDLVVVASTETTRRLQARYAIKSAAGVASLSAITVAGYAYSAGPVVGEYLAGDGSLSAALALGTADGYKRAVVLAVATRAVGVTTIPANAIDATAARRVVLGVDSDRADLFHASSTPAANTLLPLDNAGKYPSSVFTGLAGSASDVDQVDTFHANSTPTANTLLPLTAGSKYPNSVLYTGPGAGLDADQVDAIHANATPQANKLVPLEGDAKYPNSVLRTGTGAGLDADSVDSRHANLVPAAGLIMPLDGSGKIANTALYTGSGNGLDADSVDGYHAVYAPSANVLMALESGGKLWNAALKTGHGNGLDVDLLDGQQAAAFASLAHASGATLTILNTRNNGWMTYPSSFGGSYASDQWSAPVGKDISIMAIYVARASIDSSPTGTLFAYFDVSEIKAAGGYAAQNVLYAEHDGPWQPQNQIVTRVCKLLGKVALTNTANHFMLTGTVNTGGATLLYTGMTVLAWYF